MTPRALIYSVREAVSLLETEFSEFTDGIQKGRYALWVGSGISRGVAPDVRKLLLRVLNFLHLKIIRGDPDGKYKRALSDVFRKADLDIQTELTPLERRLPPDQWASIDDLLWKLQNNYSKILDIRIPDTEDDHLLWDGTDFINTFMNGAKPDTEHLCLAVLLMEGVVTDVVSANWDDYIESAIREVSAGQWSELSVKVLPADFRDTPTAAKLYKFHGCAAKAKDDPAIYRQYLVGRQEQITGWPHEQRNVTMKRELVRLAVNQRTLMIGLSAQDSDIQSLFSEASHDQEWRWPETPPALVFAEEQVGNFQEDLLKSAYRRSYTANADDIKASAHFNSYGKPLLTALVLSTLTDKFCTALTVGLGAHLPSKDLESFASDLRNLQVLIADYCRDGRRDRVSAVIHSFAQLTLVSRRGTRGPERAPGYFPFSVAPAHKTALDPTLMTGGNPELALALAILARGHSSKEWEVSFGKLRTEGALTVLARTGRTRAVLVANETAMIEAVKNGVADLQDANLILISGQSVATSRQRSPMSSPGRSRKSAARVIGLAKLLGQANSGDELYELFRQGAAL